MISLYHRTAARTLIWGRPCASHVHWQAKHFRRLLSPPAVQLSPSSAVPTPDNAEENHLG